MKTFILALTLMLSLMANAEDKCVALLQDSSEGNTEIDWAAVEKAAQAKGYKTKDFYSVNNEELTDYTLIRINTKAMKDAKNRSVAKNIWSEVEVSNLMVSKSALADYMEKRGNPTRALVAAVNQALPSCKQ